MKNFVPAFVLLLSMILLPWTSVAQVVVTIPVYPTDIDSCTVIFDAAKGDAGLKDVPPPIYAHTGVITNLSSSPSDWKYVIAPWNQNIPKALMTPLGNNLYQLKLTPSIREFYGVPAGETIEKLAFVFRNSDGSKTGREANGGDIFSDVYTAVLGVNITLPESRSLILQAGDTIPIAATSPLADSLFLYIHNHLVKRVAGTTISDTVMADNFGADWTNRWIRITAKNDTADVSDSVSYFVVSEPVIAELPAGLTDGINYTGPSSAVLSLYAPEKKFCFAIGDFNSWQSDSLHYMNRTPDGDRYWITLDGLSAGQEYRYQYLVDGTIRIGDPYADKVCDPNDQYISAETYPGLLPYPTGLTTEIATVLQTEQEPYPWSGVTFIPPKTTDLVVYELLLRDFLEQHDYQALEDTLDYLKRLGVNAIELMPVMEFEGNESWGYNPDFLFAPDKYYGPKNTLKQFIDVAHSKNIAIILDIVLNHQFGQSPLVRLYWDQANNRPATNSPWFNPIPKHPYNVGYDFNHDSPQTKAYCERVLKYWITEYHVDGFRLDLSKGFTQVNSYPDNLALWAQRDPDRISILNEYFDSVKTVKPDAIFILEHFANNDEEKELAGDGMLLWGNINNPYGEAARGLISSSNFGAVSYKQRGWTVPNLVGYMESHDEERLMYRCETYGLGSGSYSVKDTNTALERMALDAVFFYTVPGPKMLWEFGELGYDYTINYGGDRLAPKPPRWDYANEWRRRYLFNVCASLIDLKKNQDVFETSDFTMSVNGAQKKINLASPSMNVTIIGNFDVGSGDIVPGFQSAGTWYDYFTGDSLAVNDLSAAVSLDPGEYHLYTSVKLPKPLFTAIRESGSATDGPTDVCVYPNPSDGMVQVISLKPVTTIEVYGITGNLLEQVSHETRVDLSAFPAGLYYLRIYLSDRMPRSVIIIKK